MAALVAGCALMTLAPAAPTSAQDIDDRKKAVEREIHETEDHLDQSSTQLAAASRGVEEAVAKLASARDTLARTRGELAAARALDNRMKDELAAAVQDLARARKALARSRARVGEQEDVLRQVAAHQYSSSDPSLMALSMVLNSQDTTQLASQLNSVRNVLDKEAATLDQLEASRVMLAVQRSTFADAKQEVAKRRAEAARNLEHKQQLEAQAAQAEADIADLVVVRSQARKVAAKAKAEDLRRLEDLEREREEISTLLRRRAEEARRKAEAEARARAEAAAQAAAEAAARREARASEAAERRASRRSSRSDSARRAAQSSPAPRPPAPAPDSLIYPVDGYLTSSYGMRFHPVYKRWSLHDGTDFGASCGTPIRAAASGTVVAMYYNSGYGNRIVMDHGLRGGVGLGTSYNHLSSYSTYVGQRVQRGDVIGYVGTTGASTGCHLHFMVFENGATVDPMKWL
ncbi:MAG TPA: peptidoglycan DD-metalloendopeptidase family protein [Nocardioidaceae bacterium]